MKLDAKKLGLAGGIFWGAVMFIFTLIATGTGYTAEFMGLWTSVYPWYTISVLGSILGAVYGFIDGFVGLYVIAWLYNRL